jgi:hypothetical protein
MRTISSALALGSADYGDVAHFHLGPFHCYQLTHPEHIQEVLVRKAKKFRKPTRLKQVFGRFEGDGLVVSDGELWSRNAVSSSPPFIRRCSRPTPSPSPNSRRRQSHPGARRHQLLRRDDKVDAAHRHPDAVHHQRRGRRGPSRRGSGRHSDLGDPRIEPHRCDAALDALFGQSRARQAMAFVDDLVLPSSASVARRESGMTISLAGSWPPGTRKAMAGA